VNDGQEDRSRHHEASPSVHQIPKPNKGIVVATNQHD
jgi:hypothetical protein